MRKFADLLAKAAVALLLISAVASAAVAGWFVWHYGYEIGLPSPEKLAAVSPADRICSSGGKRTFVPLVAVPPIVRNALLAAEEPGFYGRPPISPFVDFAGAALSNRRPWDSAISAAVTRCLMSLSTGCCRHLDWAIGNLVLLGRVERMWSKDRIFELYLNEIWFGRSAFGAAAAADAYFGKRLPELTVDEAAYIAALARAPSLFGRDNERGTTRRNFVVDRMQEAGTISPAQAASAKQQPLSIRERLAPI